LPNSDTLIVANGGIDTHPDSGRMKLNIATMAPNLSYIADGRVIETATLAPNLHKNSIRHLAVAKHGTVAFGMQWQGDTPAPALVGLHQRGLTPQLLTMAPEKLRQMHGYVGSVAFSADQTQVIATSPRGGVVQRFDVATGRLHDSFEITDASGAATAADGVMISTGTGLLTGLDNTTTHTQTSSMRWDNHLVALS